MQQNENTKRKWFELINLISAGQFKHYSFDFWNTIAFSNPLFKEARASFIHDYTDQKLCKASINEAFAHVGQKYNLALVNHEGTMTINELYLKVFNYIGVNGGFDLEYVKWIIFDLFLKYPPTLSDDFISIIMNNGFKNLSISITSNTAFIPGFIIEKYLKEIEIHSSFSFCIFSDDVHVAKPNSKIFQLVLDKLAEQNIKAVEVLHVGDNYNTDYLGAKDSGLSPFYMDVHAALTNSRHAIYEIDSIESVPFSSIEYSKFKFGDGAIAEKYGKDLFEYFKKTLLPKLVVKHGNFLVFSSPYAQIPTSSYYLAQSFFVAFSDYLKNNQMENVKVRFCKIKRCQTYTADYGALSAEERFDLIKNDTYSFVDIPSKEDACLFIDDISITGTHQRVVENLLSNGSIETTSSFIYYAKLTNSDICPSFENELNYSYASDVMKLSEIILSVSYKITTRTTKRVLSLQPSDLNYLLNKIQQQNKYSIILEMVEMSHANDYHLIELYKKNLLILQHYLLSHNTESVNL